MNPRRHADGAAPISRKAYIGHLYAGSRFNRWFGFLTAAAAAPLDGTTTEAGEQNADDTASTTVAGPPPVVDRERSVARNDDGNPRAGVHPAP